MSEHEKMPYVPPDVAWNVRKFTEASLDEIKAKVVTCQTCPVYPACETSLGGTGWTCPQCSCTGVWVEMPSAGDQESVPDDILVIDCQKHKFERKREAENMVQCALCSGGIGELEVGHAGAKNHIIFTAYAKVPVEKRQVDCRESIAMWEQHYAEEKAKKAKNK